MPIRDASEMLSTGPSDESQLLILDNKKGPTAKSAIIKMTTSDGRELTLVEDYLPAEEIGYVQLRPLHIKVVSFEIRWEALPSGPKGHSGLSATPGNFFRVFGIRWDEHDHATLITR